MDKFYDLDNVENKREFMAYCMALSYDVKCDKLDCSKSWARTKTEKTTSEILDFTEDTDNFVSWVFVERDGDFRNEGKYIEAGLRVGSPERIDYFIWIYINLENLYNIVTKYNIPYIGIHNLEGV